MSTNAIIALVNPDNSVDSVYVHWDGYIIDGVGEMLLENYNSFDSVKLLLSKGDISALDINTEKTLYYSERTKWDKYAKENEDTPMESHPDLSQFFNSINCSPEYIYLFINEDWKVFANVNTIVNAFQKGE